MSRRKKLHSLSVSSSSLPLLAHPPSFLSRIEDFFPSRSTRPCRVKRERSEVGLEVARKFGGRVVDNKEGKSLAVKLNPLPVTPNHAGSHERRSVLHIGVVTRDKIRTSQTIVLKNVFYFGHDGYGQFLLLFNRSRMAGT